MRNAVTSSSLLGLTAVGLLAGCPDRTISEVNPQQGRVEYKDIPVTVNRDIDILFVIDDSPSMLDKQTNLKNNFSKLVTVLSTIQGGLPNLHIGVVTSDMGSRGVDDTANGPDIGSVGAGGCSGVGKDGALQVFTAPVMNAPYLIDTGFLGQRMRNYTGALQDAFSAMASAGATGCGFEQTLSAMKRVFANSANAGFSRTQARLAIIVLTDEDDCSIAHSTMLGNDTANLGIINSFRCTRFGVTCDEGGTTSDEMNATGTKNKCHANEQSPYMTDVGRYRTFLSTIKADPRDVFFGVIAGATTPFTVELRAPPGGGMQVPTLVESCSYAGMNGGEIAVPPSRIADLASSVRHASVDSVCSDLGPVMSTMGQRMKTLMGDPCLEKPIAMPAQCEVVDQNSTGEHELAACTDTTTTDCFRIVADPAICPAGQSLKLAVERSAAAPADTWTSVRCVQ
jgi:hypothetical protein